MGEHTKASSAALFRSETRRRKILENSAHRLKLIEGITNRTQSSEETDTKTSNSLDSPTGFPDRAPSATDIRNVIRNAIQEDNDLKNLSDFLLVKGETEVNENIEEIEAETVSKSKIKNSTLDILQRKRIHYILLALTVNIMFYFNFSFMFYNNVFCPFYTLKIIELIVRREDKQNVQPILHILLSGLPERIQKSTEVIFSILPLIFSDLFLYFFTFVIGTKILNLHV
ncbi:hypothetical protein RUM43_003691 [Polyplax serrata]|uniref:Uncharacterized protein n=1 Tax=Polyplax serrata TaxID=468196 RepID=A0AAN8S3B9_POLSC